MGAMPGSSVVCAKAAVASFGFASFQPGDDGVVLMNIGGAKGQTIQEIRRGNPGLQGKIVLQDLQNALDQGSLPDLDAKIMPYNFVHELQPIKGAAACFYQRIFHDWSDGNCSEILANPRPVIAKHSKLLICDFVVPDHRPLARKMLRDTKMFLVGGMEWTPKPWATLLERNGFVIEAFHGLHNADNSIIEAHLAWRSSSAL